MMGITDTSGTAIEQTGLCSDHDSPERREVVWLSVQNIRNARPAYGWSDVTGNDLIECQYCPVADDDDPEENP